MSSTEQQFSALCVMPTIIVTVVISVKKERERKNYIKKETSKKEMTKTKERKKERKKTKIKKEKDRK